MKYPRLIELEAQRYVVDVFKGYNHNLRIGESEFYDMKNLTSTHYPVLSTREKRGIYAKPKNPQGLIQKDTICYIDGQNFVVNGYEVNMGLSIAAKDCPKTIISMGAYAIIMPDKKYIRIIDDQTDWGNIEATVTTQQPVTFSLCRVDGTTYTGITISELAPENPSNMALWVDTSSTPHVLKQYSSSSGTWTSIATTYIRIEAVGSGLGKPFEVNDCVTLSGIEDEQLSNLNSTMAIWDKGDDYIVVTGILDNVITQENPITIERKMPEMDFIVESGNRLWGCKYGFANNGQVVNEIYASKLGDFKNWNSFLGLSTDSYAATVGTDGQFTGAITHLGYPIFFKENYMHKVYGTFPSNFQINTTACRGVQKGSHKSLAIVNEILYYKSRSAVCAYDGSLPQEMSYSLGGIPYSNAVACAHGNKYYISMHDDRSNTVGEVDTTQESEWHLFAYDAATGMWHKEDNTRVDDFCSCRGELYFIDHYSKQIKTVAGTGDWEDDKPLQWMAETGIIGTETPDKKYISKINVRMSMTTGSTAKFFIQYNSSGDWEELAQVKTTSLQNFTIPIKPKRCDHMRLRIEGEGIAKIYSTTKTIEQGSDWK